MNIVLKTNPCRAKYLMYYLGSLSIFILILFVHPYIIHPYISIVTIFGGILLTLYAELDRIHIVYTLMDDRIRFERGILLRNIEYVLLSDIVEITVRKSFGGRILNYGDILIRTENNKYVLEKIHDPGLWHTEILRRTTLKLPPPPVPIPTCPICDEKLIWIDNKKKWYCRKCREYR